MTSLLLAATLLCPLQLPHTINTVEITAKYYHEMPPGQQYVYHGQETAIGPGMVTIAAEGHPWHVTATIDGVQRANCSGQDAIMISGFESGDLRDWQ